MRVKDYEGFKAMLRDDEREYTKMIGTRGRGERYPSGYEGEHPSDCEAVEADIQEAQDLGGQPEPEGYPGDEECDCEQCACGMKDRIK